MAEKRHPLQHLTKTEKDSLAQVCGTTLGYINQIIYGKNRASIELAIRIEKAMDGRVSRRDLRPDIDWDLIDAASIAKHA